MDVTFFESLPFFTPSSASLQGESSNKERASCLPSLPPLPSPVHPFVFDSNLLSKDKELQVYTRRKKDTIDLLPPIDSSKPGSSPTPCSPYSDNDLPTALRKGKRSCTNHPISNFVSYHALNGSYTSFVNYVSSVTIPSNFKDVISQSNWRDAMYEEMTALEKNGT